MADAFDLNAAKIVNSPNVKAWPVTTAITSLSFGEKGQTRVEFTKRHGPGRWPDVIPPGFDGPIQFTLWLFLKMSGQWVGSGFVEFWEDREGSGDHSPPDVPSVYHLNWYYATSWTPMEQHGPIVPGELIGFMVTSGDARFSKGPYGPSERSNIVVIAATDNGVFTFGDTPVPPQPQPPTPPSPSLPYPGDEVWDAVGVVLEEDYHEAGQTLNAQSGRWFGRVIWDATAGDGTRVLPLQESITKHRGEWRAVLGLPPL